MDNATMLLLDDKDRMIRALIVENLDLKNRLTQVAHPIAPTPGCDLRPGCGACVDGPRCGGGK